MLRSDTNLEVFYFAGGTVEEGESDIDCLERELKEELSVELNNDSLHFLKEFAAPAHGKVDTIVTIRLYLGTITGTPIPSQEIAEIHYFDSTIDPKHLSLIAIEHIFPWLKAQGYIN